MGGKGGSYSGPSATEIAARDEGLRSKWTEQANVKEAQKEAFQKQLEQEFELKAQGDKARDVKSELKSREGAKAVLSNSQVGFRRDSKQAKDELVSLLSDEDEQVLGGM